MNLKVPGYSLSLIYKLFLIIMLVLLMGYLIYTGVITHLSWQLRAGKSDAMVYKQNLSIREKFQLEKHSERRRYTSIETTLQDFSKIIIFMRTNIVQGSKYADWDTFLYPSKQAIGYKQDFLEKLANIKSVKTLFLKVERSATKTLLLENYFAYSANNCSFVEEYSIYGQGFSKNYFNITCQEDLKNMLYSHSLQESTLKLGLPENFSSTSENKLILTYLNIIENGIVDNNGDVWTNTTLVIPQRCKETTYSMPNKNQIKTSTVYDEVLSITQYWGGGFYHSSIEDVPRIIPYLKLLSNHKNIKIHHYATSAQLLKLLDIPNFENRSINAEFVRSKILYSPAGTPCGTSPIFTTQLLAFYLQRKAAFKISPSSKRNIIVLIKRSKKRYFNYHEEILGTLQQEASQYNLEVKVFRDNPLPSMEETMDMFYRAVMVVAPHGAGESNLLFTQPGTVVIEGLCWDELGRGNLCYRNLSYVLGLRHHVIFSKKQCMLITDKEIQEPVSFFLQHLHGRERSGQKMKQ